ncbi:response regulator [Paenibacillus sp. IITD108]|uniref:response regulator n=1 Tax=Paenibacillus sp. IITD108 TaxID=3116649 RepID=UPI002F4224B3
MARLLIVDDEQPIADGLAEIVASWNIPHLESVSKVYNADEAIKLMRNTSINILLTDIQMPGMNGLELIRHVADTQEGVKCILLSGYSEFEYARQAIQLHAIEYLLKPVKMNALKEVLKRTAAQWHEEQADSISRQKTVSTLKEHLPTIRERFLFDILYGIRFSKEQYETKLEELELPFGFGSSARLMLIRMEEQFSRYNPHDLGLMEYALYNIVSEVLEWRFHLWHTKDDYGYHVYVLSPYQKRVLEAYGQRSTLAAEQSGKSCKQTLEELGETIRQHVQQFLKGDVSILCSQSALFPQELSSMYETTSAALLQTVGSEKRAGYVQAGNNNGSGGIQTLSMLHEPPSLIHLMQHGNWSGAKEKLLHIFDELDSKWGDSQEHLLEAYHSIYQAYLFIAHKNGRLLAELCGSSLIKTFHANRFLSVQQLKEWSMHTLEQLTDHFAVEETDNKSAIIRKAQSFIQQNLSVDISLQRIAEHVYLHPSSLSKIYRMETGQSITEYIFQVRMNSAEQLLQQTRGKVQDIAVACGYQSTPYFIKVFREYSGMTPQEYRNTVGCDLSHI